MICVNPNSIEFKQILAQVGDPFLAEVEYAKRYVASDSKVNYQLATSDEIVASEKTLRDIAARMSDRIGIPVRFISDRTQEFKGKLENNTAVINLAYATLDTPIHEILGHPIVRAIKNKPFNFKKGVKLYYLNDETPYTIEDIDQDFVITLKDSKGNLIKADHYEVYPVTKNALYENLLKELEYGKGKEVLDRVKRDYNIKGLSQKIKDNWDEGFTEEEYIEQYPDSPEIIRYSLEEQQEEAIVELLGLYTADKLDKVKDGKLISLLKRLLKEIKAFMKQLLKEKEVEVEKLPDNMTLEDLSDLLAYSNSKLILPGNEVVYTTPDNQKFKTYTEASKHISDLAKSVEDVDLTNVKINTSMPDSFEVEVLMGEDEPSNILKFTRENGQWYISDNWTGKNKIEESEVIKYYQDSSGNYFGAKQNNINSFIEKNKQYEQSKEIIEEWKKVNNIQYNPEEIYSRGQEFTSVVGAYSDFDVNLMMQNLLQHIEDNEKAGGKFTISAFTKPIDKQIGHLEGGGGKIKFKIYPQSKDILWAANTDVYSGSVWDASEKVNKDKKSELLGVSYSKYPSLSAITTVQPNLANIVDNLAHHHNELGISLTGNNFRLEYDEDIPYTTKKIIDSINSILDQKYGKLVKPEIKQKEIGTKYIAKEESAYGDFKTTIFNTEKEALDYKKYIEQFDDVAVRISKQVGIQPTQTNETLKESIDSVKEKYSIMEYSEEGTNAFNIGDIRYVFDMIEGRYSKLIDKDFTKPSSWVKITKEEYEQAKKSVNKEYTSQALINTKIAKLKEVAKKYPRSLIRSEVVKIREGLPSDNWKADMFEDDLPFQKIRSKQTPITAVQSTEVKPGVSELFESNPELANIGTPEQYTQYLDTIFPDSKVKDIVYHGSDSKKEKFSSIGAGTHFGTLKAAKERRNKAIIPVVLNIDNPVLFKDILDDDVLKAADKFLKENEEYLEYGYRNEESGLLVYLYNQGKIDSDTLWDALYSNRNTMLQILQNALDSNGYRYINEVEDKGSTSYVVFEPEQIHILGTKQDIEGFKKFTTRTTTQPTSLAGELSLYLSNKLKEEFDYNNPGNPNTISPLDILNSQVKINQQDIDDTKLNCK